MNAQNKKIFGVIGVFAFLALFIVVAQRCQKTHVPKGPTKEIKWEDLSKLDYKTNQAPEEIKNLDGQRVKIAGYIVPLTDDYFVLNEFLLVPNAQACIHVPPPPPNLIVDVTLDDPLPIEKVFNPAWITGTLHLQTTTSQYGSASYKMTDAVMEEYRY